MITILLSTLFGGLVTWWVARRYYKKAGDERRAEAQELRRFPNLILRALENAGWVQVNRDGNGKPLGLIFDEQTNLTATANLEADGSAD
jgi:Tfp pilus assembly protein PilW